MKRWLSNSFWLVSKKGLFITDSVIAMWYEMHKIFYKNRAITPYTDYGKGVIKSGYCLKQIEYCYVHFEYTLFLVFHT